MTRPERVLVTGAGGYIGRHVVKALLDAGADVIAVDRRAAGRSPAIDPRATLQQADVFALGEDAFDVLQRPDACVHLAWEAGFVHDAASHMSRLPDHYRFLTNLTRAGLRRLTVLGTVHEVGYHEGAVDETTRAEPLSLYGVAKNSLRQALTVSLRDSDAVFQWLRCFYIYGDDENNNSLFTKIVQAEGRGEELFPFTTGTRKFDFIDVVALADQIAAVALQDEVDGIVNCCTGEPVELAVQAERFIAERGLKIRLDYGRFADRPYDSPAIWGDTAKIRQVMARRHGHRTPAGAEHGEHAQHAQHADRGSR